MFTLTASIGLIGLKPALHLKKNYVEYITKYRVNESETGCYTCPYYNTNINMCANCHKRVNEPYLEKKYINEKNRYGEKKVLKKNALLLFVYLHFLNPDKNGLVYIDVDDAAELLHCHYKTIINNLRLLEKHNYIIINKTSDTGYYKAFICDYRNYFKKASENGRGYIVLSKDIFESLVNMTDINMIRLAIRTLLNQIDEERKYQVRKEKTFKEVKSDLPEYCTKKQIKDVLASELFNVLFETKAKKRTVLIQTRKEYGTEHLVKNIKENCNNVVIEFLNTINKVSDNNIYTKKFNLKEKEIKDVCNIALKYPVHLITNALKQIYDEYICNDLKIKDLGALTRTVVKYNAEMEALA